MDPAAGMRRHLRLAAIAGACVLGACERGRGVGTAEHSSAVAASSVTSAPSAAAPTAGNRWDDTLGAAIAIPSPDGGGILLFTRDSNQVTTVAVELFSHDDHSTRASLRPGSSLACAAVRAATIDSAVASHPTWSLALAQGVATPLALDAIGDIAPKDSAALAVRISRLVSALPDDSSSAPFRGLPVVVRDAWRAMLPDGVPVVVAVTMRSLNVESNPRAEIVTMVAEPESALPNAAWRTAFTRRDAGPEDRVEGSDLLSAILVGGRRPMLAFIRESERGPVVDFVERLTAGSWQLRWTTAALPCAR